MKEQLIKYAINLKDESLNASFNMHKINDPRKTFLSTRYINLFRESGLPVNYSAYYDFLSDKLGVDTSTFFERVAKEWAFKDHDKTKDAEYRCTYLIKKFVINALDGLLLECAVRDIFNSHSDIRSESVSHEDDINKCIDVKICGVKTNTFLFLQIKPMSFFRSYRSTSRYSLEKISRAATKYSLPIFLTGQFASDYARVAIRQRNSTGCMWVDSHKFCHLFYANTSQESIFRLSQETFSRLLRGEPIE